MEESPPKRRKTIAGHQSCSPDNEPSQRSISQPTRRTPLKPLPVAKLGDALSKVVLPTSSKGGSVIPSPIQLNRISELPPSSNVDTVSLRDILGDPLISECWLFNHLFDVDFILSQFHEDVRDVIQIKLVHGTSKKEDANEIKIGEAVKRHSNIQSFPAHFEVSNGMHHSKMIVLFRHDNQAQVNLLTANFKDIEWRMSQAVWRSPLLPLQPARRAGSSPVYRPPLPPIGSGARFKRDLLAYLRYYIGLQALTTKMDLYDFASVRGALVASVPGRRGMDVTTEEQNLWGLPDLKRVLQKIPCASNPIALAGTGKPPSIPNGTMYLPSRSPQIVIQVSTVDTIGDKWPREHLFPSLSAIAHPNPRARPLPPKFHIVFPTADEIRGSIAGYDCGDSISMNSRTDTQIRQLTYLRPMLRHWAQEPVPTTTDPGPVRETGRARAAPHTKTYIRFSDASMRRIEWAMLTSANVSNKAWGFETPEGAWKVSNWEIGIVLWPALWDDEARNGDERGGKAEMVPVFKKDVPEGEGGVKVGWRMPYGLPLVPYREGEMPWVAEEPCEERDWMGKSWPGSEAGSGSGLGYID